MLGGEIRGHTTRLLVDDEIDVALAEQGHVLGTMLSHLGEAHHLEYRLKHVGCRGRKFHEFESHQSHGIVKQISHLLFSCVVSSHRWHGRHFDGKQLSMHGIGDPGANARCRVCLDWIKSTESLPLPR